jgi:hypothetical protein
VQYTLCRHIKTNGTRCKAHPSPTANGATSTTASISATPPSATPKPPAATSSPGQHIELTALEDRESVQVALSVVIDALATANSRLKRATALLYGL